MSETCEERVARVTRQRVAQGLPPKITDPVVLGAFARLIREARAERAEESRAQRGAA